MFKSFTKNIFARFGIDIRRRSEMHVTPITSKWLGDFYYFVERYRGIEHLEGDIVECGIGRGRTFLYLAFLIAKDKTRRMLWGFDSFHGFPEPSAEDKSPRNPQKGERDNTTIHDVTWLLRDAGIPSEVVEKQVGIIPGFFNESLQKYTGGKIAFLHIDVDLYQSYKECLGVLYPKVVPRGVVLFDEYDDPAFPGGGKAIREYFAGKSIEIKKDSLSGKHYLIKPSS